MQFEVSGVGVQVLEKKFQMKAPLSRANGVSGYRNNVYYIPQQAVGN